MHINKKPLTIAHFTDTFYPKIDGIVTFLGNSINYFSKRDHRILVFCPTYGKQKGKYYHKNVKIFRLRSIHLHTYKEVKIAIARPKRIFQELKDFHPDIIHIHSPGIIGLLGIIAARKMHVPLIGTYHTLVSEQTDYISLGNILGLNKLVAKLYALFRKEKFRKKPKDNTRLKRLLWYISLKMYKKCDIIIAPSESIANLLKSKLRHNAISHVCCGIDLKKFYPKKCYKDVKTLSFIYVGRLSFEKNIDIIIRAFRIIDEKGINFSFKIVGNGPARRYLEGMIKRYGLESKIHFMGEVYGDALRQIYRKSDVFVTASTMETLGMSILEALASGTPVVAARKYAVPDIVKDGINGYLAEPYSAESLSEAIMKVVKDKSKIPHFGRQGAKIVQKCELGRNMKKIESLYLKAMRLSAVHH